MAFLRKSSPIHPITQAEALAFVKNNPQEIFFVQKIDIPVKLTKTAKKTLVKTIVVARDGRRIYETSHIADVGYGVDTRTCIDGSLDQYAKKPKRVRSSYKIDDGRAFDDVRPDETTLAHTDNQDIRRAFVAKEDMFLATTWDTVQFVAKGGIVTILGDEAIGNNNPCDMVMHTPAGNGSLVLTKPAQKIRRDLQTLGLEISAGMEKFLSVAENEDRRNPYLYKRRLAATEMKKKAKTSQEKINTLIKSVSVRLSQKTRRRCQPIKNVDVER